jgi:transaldolase
MKMPSTADAAQNAALMRPTSKILVDGGDPEETAHIKHLLGFVDGQTTNPSLIAKNPEVKKLVASGHRLSEQEEAAEYKKIVLAIPPLVGDAGVSIEVFADLSTSADEMLKQAREMNSWIPNAYIKYPCTAEGLKAAQRSVAEGIRVNMTLCFSQRQAAAVYAATRGSSAPVYVSPFVGRVDDIGQIGVDLVRNIKRMFAGGDGHVFVLAASIRNLQHLLYSFHVSAELVTVPGGVLEQWAAQGRPLPDQNFTYESVGSEISYEELDLEQPWTNFDIEHELTTKGIQKFVSDYRATLRKVS